jgi:hypothetical protein
MDVFAFVDRDVPNRDPVNIGDGIEWAGRKDADNHAGFAGALGRGRGGCRRQQAYCDNRLAQYHRFPRAAPMPERVTITAESECPSNVLLAKTMPCGHALDDCLPRQLITVLWLIPRRFTINATGACDLVARREERNA